jgi:hypothetical protein
VLDIVRRVAIRKLDFDEEQEATCPSCSSPGVATGTYDVEWTGERDRASAPVGAVWFTADSFECPTCRLHLDRPAELAAAKMEQRWEVENVDPYDLDSPID